MRNAKTRKCNSPVSNVVAEYGMTRTVANGSFREIPLSYGLILVYRIGHL
jgi:hypothetical protein